MAKGLFSTNLDKPPRVCYNGEKQCLRAKQEDGMAEEQNGGSTRQTEGEAMLPSASAEDAASLLACTDEELKAVDFSRLDVLVGTVRSDGQMDYCLEAGVYYVPAKTVSTEVLPVGVIALYEEGLTRPAGIRRYGRVTETRVVRRSDIPVPMSRPNPEEAYYLFSVAGWETLDAPIAIEGTSRGKPMLTNEFLLTHCRRSYQLLVIRSPEEYRLCELLCRLGEAAADKPVFRRVGERHIVTLADGRIRLLDASGHVLLDRPASALRTDPADLLRRAAGALGL
jgi:hypothetical protein